MDHAPSTTHTGPSVTRQGLRTCVFPKALAPLAGRLTAVSWFPRFPRPCQRSMNMIHDSHDNYSLDCSMLTAYTTSQAVEHSDRT
jgi:hypothetical protein